MALVQERTSSRTGLWAGAALVVLVIVAVAVIVLGGDGGDKATTRSPSRGESEPAGKDKAATATLTAENVTFTDVYGAQIPSSPAGPKETGGGRARGFARSPAGAVLAAAHIFARSEEHTGPGVFEPTITEQAIGPDKDKVLANAQRDYAERAARDGTPPGAELSVAIEEGRANRVSLWAYRVDAYDDSSAAVNLVLRQFLPGTAAPAYVNFALTVKWIDGDWRLVAPLNGEFSSVAQRLSEVPTSYVVIGKD